MDINSMTKKKQFWLSLPIIAFATLALAGFVYLGNYTRFMADDYCSAYYAHRFGLLRSIWYWYITWSGRYTAFAFDWLILIQTLGPYGAHLVPPLAIVIWIIATVAAIYLSLKRIAPHPSIFSIATALGVSFTLTTIILSPDIAQSFFWLNGMRSYSLPLFIASIYVFLFQWLLPRLKSDKAILWACILAFLLTFGNGGFSETYAVMQLMLLALLAGLHWLSNGRKFDTIFKILAAATLGAIVSMIVIALAPGNELRKATFPPSPSFIKWMEISIGAYLSFFQGILLNPQKLSALIGALLVSAWAGTRYKSQITFQRWTIPVQILGGLALFFICIPPAVFAYVEPPPPRTLSIAAFALVAFWMNASFLTGSWLADRVHSTSRLEVGLLIPASLIIALTSVLTLSYVNQHQGAYISFAKKWDAADAQILQARAQHLQSVTIPKMDNWADLDHPNDNPKFWATACYTQFYGIQVYGPPY
jgi:hypothetical protein